jgi:hypothetical protein
MVILLWIREFFVTASPNKTSAPLSSRASLEKPFSNQSLLKIIDIYSQARSCNDCFVNVLIGQRPDITGGQPRWIGKHYFNETYNHADYPRVLVLLHRPGQLGGRAKNFDHARYNLLAKNMHKPDSWDELMELLDADSKHWGKFDSVYKDSMNLNEDFTSFLNIGLCAGLTSSDLNPLPLCFGKYTRSMLELFQPNVLLLNGRKVQEFYSSFVASPQYKESRNVIEKMLITKENCSVKGEPIFIGQPIKVKSYAARSGDVELEARNIGWEMGYLYPPYNGAKEQINIKKESSTISYDSNPPWAVSELTVALDFYYSHKPYIPNKKSKEILELSQLIKKLNCHSLKSPAPSFRNENGVYLKLMNFLSLDKTAEGLGMVNASNADKEIWNKYLDKPSQLKAASQQIISILTIKDLDTVIEELSKEEN